MRPVELLLNCLGEAETAHTPWPTSRTAWEELAREALRHGLAPLLYRRLQCRPPAVVPPGGVLERLRDLYIHNEFRNHSVYTELARTLGALGDAGVEVIVLKGAFLAEAVYGDVALRPMQDVDLLFRPSDLERAQSVLRDLGYALPPAGAVRVEELRHCHLPPATRSGALPIEIHWTTVGPSPITPDLPSLWSTARATEVAGVKVLALSPEHLLHHLCLHISCQHRMRVPLLQLHDVAAVVRHYPALDWERFDQIVRDHGSQRFVCLVLSLARRAFGADIPSIQRLQPGRGEGSEAEAALLDTAWICLTGPRRREFPRLFVQLDELRGTRARVSLLRTRTASVRERIRREKQLPPHSLRLHWYLLARVLSFVRRRGRLAVSVLLRGSVRASLASAAGWTRLQRSLPKADLPNEHGLALPGRSPGRTRPYALGRDPG